MTPLRPLCLQVNFYERSLELMRNNMEVERKDISQSFKVTSCLRNQSRHQMTEFMTSVEEWKVLLIIVINGVYPEACQPVHSSRSTDLATVYL